MVERTKREEVFPRAQRNRLSKASSPYLRQHAQNPVDWYEWGSEAFAKAQALDRPILLSVGYSACHWCHVMAHESFEDPHTAALMNERFINIKVDREERPDIDAIYQKVVQLMGQGGGWPLTVFLTPKQEPFYGGTYFPPRPNHGRPAFRDLLIALSDLYHEKPDDVSAQAAAFMEGLADLAKAATEQVAEEGGVAPGSFAGFRTSARRLLASMDSKWGGFGSAPKFPNPTALEILWRVARCEGDPAQSARSALIHTLECMARGGIHDHLGGGFSRYSVDREWLVPHFEKMLYDNAQLLPLYAEVAAATDNGFFRDVAVGITRHLRTDMMLEGGAYASALDADSEGEEGKYYGWTPRQIRDALEDPEIADMFCTVYGVTEGGNFEQGRSILHLPQSIEEIGRTLGRPESEIRDVLHDARKRLLELRSSRIPPARDDKILTSWNALVVSGLSRAAAAADAWGNPDLARRWQAEAVTCCERLLTVHIDSKSRVYRVVNGDRVHTRAILDDVAFLARACLDLHELTLAPRFIDHAVVLSKVMVEQYGRSEGGFHLTASDGEVLIERSESLHDGPLPSGAGVALEVLRRLEQMGHADDDLRDMARKTTERLRGAANHPFAYASVLLGARIGDPEAVHVTIRAPKPDEPRAQDLARVARIRRLGLAAPVSLSFAPADEVAVVVCRHETCTAPLSTESELEEALKCPP